MELPIILTLVSKANARQAFEGEVRAKKTGDTDEATPGGNGEPATPPVQATPTEATPTEPTPKQLNQVKADFRVSNAE